MHLHKLFFALLSHLKSSIQNRKLHSELNFSKYNEVQFSEYDGVQGVNYVSTRSFSPYKSLNSFDLWELLGAPSNFWKCRKYPYGIFGYK